MDASPILFIPVETKVRELHAKILLACHAADDGFSAVLGKQTELLRRVKRMPRGIYLEKGVSIHKEEGVRLLKDVGNQVAAWCEEGLVIVNPETYARDRVSAKAFSMMDVFFAWGSVQAGAIALKMGPEAEKIVLAGNPRFDLLREPFRAIFEPEAQRLRGEHGDFLLINTNFGLYNNFFGPDYFMDKVMRGWGRIQNAGHERFLKSWVEHVRRLFEAFKDFLPVLGAAFPERKIVLRPHPSENHDAWREAVRGLANVEVIHHGNVIPWLLACQTLIHNCCTTGVEAHVLGKPVVSYRPVRSDVFEFELPRVVSIPAFTAEETVRTVKDILAGKSAHAPEAGLGKKHAVSIDGPFSCRIIMDALKNLAEQIESAPAPPGAATARLRWRAKDAWYDFKVGVNQVLGRRREDAQYVRQKLPDITLEEVRETISLFQKVSGRFGGVTAEQVPGAQFCHRIFKKF